MAFTDREGDPAIIEDMRTSSDGNAKTATAPHNARLCLQTPPMMLPYLHTRSYMYSGSNISKPYLSPFFPFFISYITSAKNNFSEMKRDVWMSLHEKEGKQEDAYTKTETYS